jgi:hypothetical protein
LACVSGHPPFTHFYAFVEQYKSKNLPDIIDRDIERLYEAVREVRWNCATLAAAAAAAATAQTQQTEQSKKRRADVDDLPRTVEEMLDARPDLCPELIELERAGRVKRWSTKKNASPSASPSPAPAPAPTPAPKAARAATPLAHSTPRRVVNLAWLDSFVSSPGSGASSSGASAASSPQRPRTGGLNAMQLFPSAAQEAFSADMEVEVVT